MSRRVVVLTGGVGGAKLVLGLAHAIPAQSITAIVNTGDDFTHLGLHISPDIDTLVYTLSDMANAAQGWGLEGESWNFMAALRRLGGEDWFALGDADLAMHVARSSGLSRGETLSGLTRYFAERLGIATEILPMSDDAVETQLETDEGLLPFQRYFVARRCLPVVSAIRFAGTESARPAPGVLERLGDPTTRAILIAPSNPFLSIDPILAVPGIRAALAAAAAPVVAVSPLVGGKAVKGPTSKLLAELRLDATATTIARHYAGIIDGLLVDARDPPDEPGIAWRRTDTLMRSLDDRIRVGTAALDFADSLKS